MKAKERCQIPCVKHSDISNQREERDILSKSSRRAAFFDLEPSRSFGPEEGNYTGE